MEITQQFDENECPRWIEKTSFELWENKDILIEEFCCSLQKMDGMFDRMRESICSIEISILRHSLLATNTPCFLLEAFHEFGMFGGLLFQFDFEIPVFSKIWIQNKMEILTIAKKYAGKIPLPIADKILLSFLWKIDETLAEVFKSTFPENEWLENIKYSIGEFRRFQFRIH